MDYLRSYLEKWNKAERENMESNTKFKVPTNIMEICFKKCPTAEDFKKNLKVLRGFLEGVPKTHPNSFSAIQIVLSIFIVTNK